MEIEERVKAVEVVALGMDPPVVAEASPCTMMNSSPLSVPRVISCSRFSTSRTATSEARRSSCSGWRK